MPTVTVSIYEELDRLRKKEVAYLRKIAFLEWRVNRLHQYYGQTIDRFRQEVARIKAELVQEKAELAREKEAELARERAKEEMSKLFRKVAFQIHPDRNPDNPAAAEVMSTINQFWQALKKIW